MGGILYSYEESYCRWMFLEKSKAFKAILKNKGDHGVKYNYKHRHREERKGINQNVNHLLP